MRISKTTLVLSVMMALAMYAIAGNLEPDGPPAPTMKTLDEVEPRIPIQSLSGDGSAVYVIDRPGSYYLAGDINIDLVDINKHGIRVDVNNVTIDLMGYTLKGSGSGSGSGISMYGRSNVEIRNGTICNVMSGVIENGSTSSQSHRVIGVRTISNRGQGIFLYGRGHLIRDCTVAGNVNNGVEVLYGSTVTGNICYGNGGDGIKALDGCTVIGNTAMDNTNHGILVFAHCFIDQNTTNGNGTNISAGTGCVGQNVAP